MLEIKKYYKDEACLQPGSSEDSINTAKERISELEDRSIGITQTIVRKEK